MTQMSSICPTVTTCPACGSTSLEATADLGHTAFVCSECHAIWRAQLGFLWRLDDPQESGRAVDQSQPSSHGTSPRPV